MQQLGILDQLLSDNTITEIMVNGASKIFIERNGKLELTGFQFNSEDEVYEIIETILKPMDKHIDNKTPYVDARLMDGSRVNIILPPLSIIGPMITIRKFCGKFLEVSNLIESGTINKNMGEFLRICVMAKRNIIVSGGTGSGKTTLLNVLSSLIDETERIITIEDIAELKLQKQNLGILESRQPDNEGKNAVTIRQLLINALRMRPDRIIVGECRGIETFDMLQAMNTGHNGSMTTVHANSSRDCLKRLEVMALMCGFDWTIKAIRQQIASAINIIIQIARLSDGTRKVTSISEVTGMEGDIITLSPIFELTQSGDFKSTTVIPLFIEQIRLNSIPIDMKIFQ